MKHILFAAVFAAVSGLLSSTLAPSAQAQSLNETVPGPSTNLPLPRFVSLKDGEARARRGPSLSHRVDWLYTRRGLPLRVVNEFEHWRQVVDSEGEGGWIHFSLLSGVRTVLVSTDMAPLRARSSHQSDEIALLERGVIGRIMECDAQSCRISVEGTRGWIARSDVWGLLPGEILD